MADVRRYECEFYSVMAPSRSCLFCSHCTDVFWDYANGPYMFFCDADGDVVAASENECNKFEEDVDV